MLIKIVGPYSLETHCDKNSGSLWLGDQYVDGNNVSCGLVSGTKCPEAPTSTPGVSRAKSDTFEETWITNMCGFGVFCLGAGGLSGGGSFETNMLTKIVGPYSLETIMWITIVGLYSLQTNMLIQVVCPL